MTANESKKWQEFSAPKVWARFTKDGVDGQDGVDGKDGEQGPQGPQGIDGKPADVKIQKYIFGSKTYPFIGANPSQLNPSLIDFLPDFNELPLGKWNVLNSYVMSGAEIDERIKALDKFELIEFTNNPNERFIKRGNSGEPSYTNICGNSSFANGGISFNAMFPNGDFSIHIWCLEGTQTHEYDETNKEWKLSDTIKWNLPLYKTKLQQSCKGDTGETGKIGNVVYPAGEYDETKIYVATDKKSPYVVDPLDGEYYMLKEYNTWIGRKEYYGVRNGYTGQPYYSMFCIDPDDVTDTNSVKLLGVTCYPGQTVNLTPDIPNNQSLHISQFNKSNIEKYKYGYVQLNIQGVPKTETTPNGILSLRKYYTLNSDETGLVVASKYIYSVDGVSETWIPDRNQTPSQNALEENSLWEKFESFEAIYAKICIIENGTIGSAVYSGDFMFSQQGVDNNGNSSTSYQNFNTSHIYDDDSTFKPNICMNFKTGEMYASGGNIEFSRNNINLSGYMTKKISYINSADDLVKYCYLDNFDVTGTRSMLIDILKTGSLICFNYMPNSSSSTSAGEMTVKLPRMRQYTDGASSWVKNNDGTIDFNQINLCRMISETQILIYNNDTSHTSSKITLNGPLYSETDYYHSNAMVYGDGGRLYGYTEATSTSVAISKNAPVTISIPIPKLTINLMDWKSKRSPGILPENVNRSVSVFKGEFISLTPKIVSSQEYEDVVWIYSTGKHPGGF